MKVMKLVIGLIGIVIILITFNFYISNKKHLSSSDQPNKITAPSQNLVKNSNINTWRTFLHKDSIYSIKYPPSVGYEQVGSSINIKDSTNFYVSENNRKVLIAQVKILEGQQDNINNYLKSEDTPDKKTTVYSLYPSTPNNEHRLSLLSLTFFPQATQIENMSFDEVMTQMKASIDIKKNL